MFPYVRHNLNKVPGFLLTLFSCFVVGLIRGGKFSKLCILFFRVVIWGEESVRKQSSEKSRDTLRGKSRDKTRDNNA